MENQGGQALPEDTALLVQDLSEDTEGEKTEAGYSKQGKHVQRARKKRRQLNSRQQGISLWPNKKMFGTVQHSQVQLERIFRIRDVQSFGITI